MVCNTLKIHRFFCIAFLLMIGNLTANLWGESPKEWYGQLMNGTTQKPVGNRDVVLFKAGTQGMEAIRTLHSNPAGQFLLGDRELFQKDSYILQTTFQGVHYSISLHSLKDPEKVLLIVYEVTERVENLRVSMPHMMVRRVAEVLQVSEIFQIDNQSDPPKTMFSKQGGFRFALPKGARLIQAVSTGGGSLMPVTAETRKIDDASGWFLDNPLKPGKNMIQVAYEMDYSTGKVQMALKYFYPLSLFQMIVSPGDIQIHSSFLREVGRQGDKMRLFSAPALPANTEMTVDLSGGSLPGNDTLTEETESVTNSGREEGHDSKIIAVPPRLAAFRFIILGNLVLLLAAFIGWTLTREPARVARQGSQRKARHREAMTSEISSTDNPV